MSNAALNLESYESRQAIRADVFVDVNVFSDHNFWTGLTMNLSEGGVFVATYADVAVGTPLTLQIELPFEDEPIVVRAEVRWVRDYTGRDVPPGLGLRFIDLDRRSLERIRSFVSLVRDPLLFEP